MDLGSTTGACPSPKWDPIFRFRILFRRKVPASEVDAPKREILDPPLVFVQLCVRKEQVLLYPDFV